MADTKIKPSRGAHASTADRAAVGWRVVVFERKLDGFRAKAIKIGGRVPLRSRNNKDFNRTYPAIVNALSAMPDETVIDGEIVALD
jgi:bifunctional non-homologous end joining protein LigD